MAGRGTPATVALERDGAPFSVHTYEHDPAADSYGAEAVRVMAERLAVDPARVFKTLVAAVDGALHVAVLPVPATLDLKALAAVAGGKRAAMAEPTAAERATGYVVGGISPLGQRRRLPTVLDAGATTYDSIFVSAGRRGMEIELAPADLVRLTDATVAPVARG